MGSEGAVLNIATCVKLNKNIVIYNMYNLSTIAATRTAALSH